MSNKEKQLSSKLIYKGKIITCFVDDVECPNGNISIREYVKHPGAVAILAKLENKFIFEKQYRYPFDDFFLEVPAGKLEPGEDPKEAALRELEEETGYIAKELTYLGEFCPTIAYSNEVIHLFFAENLEKGQQKFDFDENLEIVLLEENTIKNMVNDNSIKDGKTLGILCKYFVK